MRYLSVCSGIEAATVAWHPLGWTPAAFSEIEAFPRAVLAHHYPEVPLHGDFTTIKGDEYGAVDLLVGGTPCQSFSVAGLRKGLDDPRGNLMLEYGALAKRLGARWLVWENVPGVLSSNGGRDFAAFLGMLAELGYGFAYRVLDAQYFGVAQRRRRVFVVACLGDWRAAAAVLFERHSLSGHPAPRRESGQGVTGTISSRTTGGGGLGTDFECAGGLQVWPAEVPSTLNASFGSKLGLENQHIAGGQHFSPLQLARCLTTKTRIDAETETLIPTIGGVFVEAPIAFDSRQDTVSSREVFGALGSSSPQAQAVAHAIQAGALRTNPNSGPDGLGVQANVAYTLEARAEVQCTQYGMAVRRLTPRECERLQGFPDDYTLAPHRGKPAADGPRYKALGNSMAVPVMHWIGKRIEAVAVIQSERKAAA
jgi:DNA (cytosine-5)-methyltransferase 1